MKKRPTYLLIFFIIAATTAIIVRYAQFIGEIIDYSTGFFFHYAGGLRHAFYVVLALAFAGFIALSFIEKRRGTCMFKKRMSHFDDTDVALCGIMYLLAGFSVAFTGFRTGFDEMSVAGVITVVLGTLAYGSAGITLLLKKRMLPSVGMMMLALVAFYVVRLVTLFLEEFVILNMTEYLIKLILLILTALFYLSAGRMLMRAENKTTRLKASVLGFMAALVAITEIIAKMLYWYGGPEVMRSTLAGSSKFIMPDMLMAAEAIALLTFMLCLVRVRSKNEKAKSAKGLD